ncbi:MAG: indolepyruvate oxidoreductase subunit beta [Deltaproteobacteria bacterium]|nr:indolepyruvate oxidoreductase subunit beta [Deltaproteobacteria bacterium]
MKRDIILAGVGGQGILSIATVIGYVAVQEGLFLKQAEVHGMSQRGGDVQSNLRISSEPIFSDLVAAGKADLIISVEPMESIRYLPFLHRNGWLITSTTPYKNINDYPGEEELLNEIKKVKNHVAIPAEAIAKELGSARSSNIVMLGAASAYLDLPFEKLEDGLRAIFGRKGEKIVNANISAIRAGRDFAAKYLEN